MKKDKKQSFRPSSCHPNKPLHCRGLCRCCYEKWLKSVNKEYAERQAENQRKWAKANPDKMKEIERKRRERYKSDPKLKLKERNRGLLRKYGITDEEYLKMLEKQNGVCKLCRRPPNEKKFHVDHCHETGRIRGVLCHQCNWYLGVIERDVEILDRIKGYLELS
jgi:hypothetical protein